MPYPAETRAKGWRFELDYERIEQSDTWDMAAEVPMAGAALLMMWYQAWKQVPCGSFPSDEDVIRAKCRVPVARWDDLRPILMRGWWLGDDGRLYHDTLVERVREMLAYREKEAGRRGRNRKPRDDGFSGVPDVSGGGPAGVPRDASCETENEEEGFQFTNHVPRDNSWTTGVVPPQSRGSPDTGTGTGTYVSPPFVAKAQKSSTQTSARLSKNSQQPEPGAVLTAADAFGAQLLQLRLVEVGIEGVAQTDARLVELARAGVLPDELEAAAKAALKARAEHPLPWAIARIEAQRRDAQARQIEAAAGPALDPDSRVAIEADGVRFGIGVWKCVDDATGRSVPWPNYKARVLELRSQAAGGGGVAP